jgi:hypothetical protein
MRISSLVLLLGIVACDSDPPPRSPHQPHHGPVPQMTVPAELAGMVGDHDLAPFDRGAAARAIGGVDAQSCRSVDGAGNGHITLLFTPDGIIAMAMVDDGPFVGARTAECLVSRFVGLRIPPFKGSPVKVGKTFIIR